MLDQIREACASPQIRDTEPRIESDTDSLAFRAAGGDESAFAELYLRCARRTHSLLQRFVGSADVDDLNQETWVQVFRKLNNFRGESAFTTWLHRLTVNTALMHLRKNYVRKEHVLDEEERFPEEIVPGTERPERMSIIDRIALDDAMELLPDGYLKVIVYHDVYGYEHEEIAEIIGCSIGTSKSQLHKARRRLAGLLNRKRLTPGKHVLAARRFDRAYGIELPEIGFREIDAFVEIAESLDYELTDEGDDI